jgi:hypothetical protein
LPRSGRGAGKTSQVFDFVPGVVLARAMRSIPFVVLCSLSAAAQQRIPFAFDAGLAADPTTTEQKRIALDGKLPAGFALPSSFVTQRSAPQGVTTPTTTLWLWSMMTDAYARAASAGPSAMGWPASTSCVHHQAFSLPALPSGCDAAAITSTLADLDACADVDAPERYVMASLIPPSTSSIPSYVDAHTQTIEDQIALAGAGLALQPVPDGLLPPDWVPTLRSILWKIRSSAYSQRLQQGRAAYAQALMQLNACGATDAAMRVQQLDDELVALGAHVSAVQSDGLTKATQQAQCLASRSRTRPALPYPALTDEEREFIGFWLGGVYWRMRGGGLLPTGATQTARRDFARRPFDEIARIANGSATATGAADAIYCNLGNGWGSWMDMGTFRGSTPADNQDMYEDLVDMTNRGWQEAGELNLTASSFCASQLVFSVSKPAAKYLTDDSYDATALLAGGLSMGPCYLYALNPMGSFTYYTHAAATPPYDSFMEGFTTMGEFCTGASLGLGLTRALLDGKPNGQPPVDFCQGQTCGVDACGNSCGPPCQSPDAGQTGAGGGSSGAGGGAENAGGGAQSAGGGAQSAGGGVQSAGGGSQNTAGGTQSTGGGTMRGGGGGDSEPHGCGCDGSTGLGVLSALIALRRPRRRVSHS